MKSRFVCQLDLDEINNFIIKSEELRTLFV